MIRRRLRPGPLAIITLIVGVVLIAAALYALVSLLYGPDESRRTISRAFALIPVTGLAGLLGVFLGVRAAFPRVCASCSSRLETLPVLLYAASDGGAIIKAVAADDQAALLSLTPVARGVKFSDYVPGTIGIESSACPRCGAAGTINVFRAGVDASQHMAIVPNREFSGSTLKKLDSAWEGAMRG